jgi:cytochrome c553
MTDIGPSVLRTTPGATDARSEPRARRTNFAMASARCANQPRMIPLESMKRAIVLGCVAVVAMWVAQPAVHASGSAPAGKDKSLACAACHLSSDAQSETPRLAGQRPSYVAKQLRAFRKGDRANPLMNAIAKQLSDADVDDLAAFWSSQPAGSDTRPPAAVEPIKRSRMGFPREFPTGFVLYLSSNNVEHNTIRKTYINALGFAAARANKPLPDGTVIMAVIYAARVGRDKQPVLENDGTWTADKITAYAGMEARAGWGSDIPVWLRNATWNYTLFAADKSPRADANQAECLACHKAQAVVGYLFTFTELWDKARAR